MLRFYLDEDVPYSLMHALHTPGVEIVSTAAVERRGRPDDDPLRYATAEGRVIVTCNVGDFAALHREALTAGQSRAAIVAISEQRFPAGPMRRSGESAGAAR